MNRADKENGLFRLIKNKRTCVFISYKKEDQNIAILLGEFLTTKLNVDIYLDIFDVSLQEAVSVDNDKKIVESIKEGLSCSNILLCIISDNTKLSWWVPYEIGLADNIGLQIASIKTKAIDDFPSFLKTQKTINDFSELVKFILNNGRYGSLFYSNEKLNNILQDGIGKLNEYFD